MAATATFVATGRTDGRDWLVEAEEPLAGLQLRSGGELPGIVATPALLELVRKSRRYRLRLARAIEVRDTGETVTAWVEVEPDGAGEGCRIGVADWKAVPLHPEAAAGEDRRAAIERHVAELTARLGPQQEVIAVECDSAELAETAQRLREGRGNRWTELVEVAGDARRHSLHWRLLDGARIVIPGSVRTWKAVLLPLGRPEAGAAGFDLLFVAEEPPLAPAPPGKAAKSLFGAAIGREIAPVLFQPMSRIIANADTIRTQLAGPLSDDYSKYADDIAAAGEHLMALIDDLADLEVVEADDFETARERIDLADVARRAADILGGRANEREITVDTPQEGEVVLAAGEFRRVLQILLNLLGNALRYGPERSQVWLSVEQAGERARVTVADRGEGLTTEQQAKVFDKFERLGRSDDGGSGLGLYISRRLARAMDGELSVESSPGQGARFTLDLPAFGADPG